VTPKLCLTTHWVRFNSGVPVVFGTAISVASMLLGREKYPCRRDRGPFRIEVFNPANIRCEQTYEMSWGIKVSTYYLNQKLEPNFFTFDTE